MSRIKTGRIETKAKIYIGTRISTSGMLKTDIFHQSDLTNSYLPVPVTWDGWPANLHFWSWRSRKTPFNPVATDLIKHPGFTVQGDAIVITQVERWHQFRVEGDLNDAREMIAHLGMKEGVQVVFKPSGRHKTHQYIYVKSDNDAFAVRLAI